MKIIGRVSELEVLEKAISLRRNLLIEGPVGVGKTFLVQAALGKIKKTFERIDGDTRYTEQKLTGWFDPPLVLKKGYKKESFIDGPLSIAMKKGCVLFINELNRMPEAVQNILLPAMDERQITIPRLGSVQAKDTFLVIATQNPREFTATHALSEALMDRFEILHLDYQNQEEECEIVKVCLGKKVTEGLIQSSVNLVRATRSHPAIKRGASVRAAIALCDLLSSGLAMEKACLMALPSRIELVSSEDDMKTLLLTLLSELSSGKAIQKKKLELHS